MGRCDPGFAQVDADDSRLLRPTDSLRGGADGRDGGAGADLDDDNAFALLPAKKGLEAFFLLSTALVEPGEVAEHEDIRPCYSLAVRAGGKMPGAHSKEVDVNLFLVRPDFVATGLQTLQVMNGAVDFKDFLFSKTGFLKLAIDIGGDDKGGMMKVFDPVAEDGEAGIGDGITIKVGAVAVKAPSKGGIALKVGGVGGFDKGKAELTIGRISVPETFIAAEIRETGIDPHPGAGGDDQRFSGADSGSSSMLDCTQGHRHFLHDNQVDEW